MSRPGAVRSRVAVFVFIALCTSLVTPVISAPVQPGNMDARVRIAVGDCADGTNGVLPGLSDSLKMSLTRSLANEEGVRLVGHEVGEPDRVLTARVVTIAVD